MKRTLCLMLGLSITAVTAWAGGEKTGELTDPVEILKKVDASCKAVKAVKYDATGVSTGAMAQRAGSFEASIVVSGFLRNAPEKYKFELKFTPPGATEPILISGGTDNDMFFVVHHKDKKAYEDIDIIKSEVRAGNIIICNVSPLAKHNIEESIVVFKFKEIDKPFLFWTNPNGDHNYDAARLLATVMRDIKGRIAQELDC